MIIYITTNLINGKKYIGQDSNDDPNYIGSGKIIRSAIKKYGIKNFKKEILDSAITKDELNKKEIHYIQKYNAIQDDDFYNITKGGGGCLGYKHTKKHINYMKKIKRNKKWRESIAKALTGKTHTKERIKNNAKSQIGIQAGNKNPRARKFLITSPSGIKFKIHGELKKFCISNKLSVGCMLKVAKGKQNNHQGWNIKYI